VALSVRAQGRARRRLLLRPRPGSGEDAIPPEAEVEAEPWGRARRSFLLRPRLNLAVVSLTLVGGTAVGAGRAALFSSQVGQRKGEVTVVTSTLPTEAHVSG
jgi:hypothetical protein